LTRRGTAQRATTKGWCDVEGRWPAAGPRQPLNIVNAIHAEHGRCHGGPTEHLDGVDVGDMIDLQVTKPTEGTLVIDEDECLMLRPVPSMFRRCRAGRRRVWAFNASAAVK
jgi:hypothetical protein